jgi:hypothetical protein
MTHRTYSLLTGVIFLLIAALHCARAVLGWSAVVNGINIPMWMSWIAMFFFAFLSFIGFWLSRKAS